MKKTLAITFLIAVSAAANVGAAPAAFYTNVSDFLTAITGKPSFTENYSTYSGTPGWGNRLDTNNIVFTNGSSFGYTANIPGVAPAQSFWGDTYNGMRALSSGDPADQYILTNFSLNTFAFGGYFAPVDGSTVVSGGSVTIDLLFGDSTSTNITASRASANLNDWFFGWVTDAPGTAVKSVSLDGGPDYVTAGTVTLAVPEPSTYALLGLAAAGLAGYVIRRRRS